MRPGLEPVERWSLFALLELSERVFLLLLLLLLFLLLLLLLSGSDALWEPLAMYFLKLPDKVIVGILHYQRWKRTDGLAGTGRYGSRPTRKERSGCERKSVCVCVCVYMYVCVYACQTEEYIYIGVYVRVYGRVCCAVVNGCPKG